jgi:hypothetical protein
MPNGHVEFSRTHFERFLAEVFRRAHWRVECEPQFAQHRLDLFVHNDEFHYAVEIKVASEGRRDRLVPLAAQAILQVQAAVRTVEPTVLPLAVVCAPRISESSAEQIHKFAKVYAPGVAVGVFDLEGFRSFAGAGLEILNQKRQLLSTTQSMLCREQPQVGLSFSDANQWLLKVMLAPMIPESMLTAPRGEYRNVSQLARASSVSIMSAFRFVKQLRAEGFLDESGDSLRLVRIEQLMQRWQAANSRWREIRMRWLIHNDESDALNSAVRSVRLYEAPSPKRRKIAVPNSDKHIQPSNRVCVGLFSAAELLGLSFVHGAPRHLYVEHAEDVLFHRLGLVPAEHEQVDVYVRIPTARVAIFRAAVNVNGVLASDVLQVWLDVAAHPARGAEQAEEIWRRVLAPMVVAK